MERRVLLGTLADRLPPKTIRFSSKLAKIEANDTGETLLELTDGTTLLAKVTLLLHFNSIPL